ncbi:hypothetical protein [Geotalea toluenoxydans]
MKKIIILSLVALLSYGANAFAAAGALASGAASNTGAAIFGAPDSTEAAKMNNRLVSTSKGVGGVVIFTADAANKTSAGYVIACKHLSGTKWSGTSNDSTKIYWKQSSVATTLTASEVGNSDVGSTNFAAGTGWTEY